MREQLELIKKAAEEHLKKAQSVESLEELRIKYLGKKGELTAILKAMTKLSRVMFPKRELRSSAVSRSGTDIV